MVCSLRILLAALIATALAGPAAAAQLQVKSVKASSTLADADGVSYAPEKAADGLLETYWAEGEASAGLGDWIEFDFGQEVTLTRIDLYNGNWTSRDFFGRHNRIKQVQVKFSSAPPQKLELADRMERQSLKLSAPVKTRTVRLVLKEMYPGTTFNDTCLTEIQFFNTEPGETVEGIKTKASSSLAPDRDASYGPENLFDGIQDTPWCEGKKGSGIGESLTLTLPGGTRAKALRVLNGVAASEETYKKNNRATRLKIELGGASKEIDVADQFGTWQTLPLEGTNGPVLKLTILGVAAGSSFDDTCMSEMQVIPDR